MELIPQARKLVEQAGKDGKKAQADKVRAVIQQILDRPEHKWFEQQKIKKTQSSGPATKAGSDAVRTVVSWFQSRG